MVRSAGTHQRSDAANFMSKFMRKRTTQGCARIAQTTLLNNRRWRQEDPRRTCYSWIPVNKMVHIYTKTPTSSTSLHLQHQHPALPNTKMNQLESPFLVESNKPDTTPATKPKFEKLPPSSGTLTFPSPFSSQLSRIKFFALFI